MVTGMWIKIAASLAALLLILVPAFVLARSIFVSDDGSCAGAPPVEPATKPTASLVSGLKEINYFPAAGGWTYMWTRWDEQTIDLDFERIAGLGANAVRIVVPAATFGYPDPKPEMLARLDEVVRLADRRGLRIHLTLFDWWESYSDVKGSARWVSRVLAPYRGDTRLAAIEIQNEPDTSNDRVLAWVAGTAPCVQRFAGAVPVTISADSVEKLRRLQEAAIPVDFYSFHYFGPATLAATQLRSAVAIAGTKPLFVGETGYATLPSAQPDSGPSRDQAWQHSYQEQYFRTVQQAAMSLGLPAVAPWTLYDFAPQAIPPSRTASIPEQYRYGLFQADGRPKPAATVVASIFNGKPLDQSFNNGFEQGAGAGIPANWNVWLPALATFARDSTTAHSGSASALIRASSAGSAGVPAYYLSPIAAFLPGQTYSSSVWAKGSNATGDSYLGLAWFDAAGRWIRTDPSDRLRSGTTDWSRLAVTAVAPPATAYVEIHLASANNSGAVWFDDVSFDALVPNAGQTEPRTEADPGHADPGSAALFKEVLS
jgi:hypothetical protein